MPADDDDRDDLERVAWWAGRAIAVGVLLLPMFFTWLYLNRDQIFSALENASPEFILKAAVSLYFICWAFGAPIDLGLQKAALAKDPNRGRLTFWAVFFAVATIVAGGFLIYASFDSKWIAWALAAFWTIHSAGILYMRYFMGGMYRESAAWYFGRQDFFRLEKVLVLARYQFGKTIWFKHTAGFFLIGLLLAVSMLEPVRQQIAEVISKFDGRLTIQIVAPIIPAAVFTFFVLFVEGIQWTLRVSTIASMFVLNRLRRTYKLSPLGAS